MKTSTIAHWHEGSASCAFRAGRGSAAGLAVVLVPVLLVWLALSCWAAPGRPGNGLGGTGAQLGRRRRAGRRPRGGRRAGPGPAGGRRPCPDRGGSGGCCARDVDAKAAEATAAVRESLGEASADLAATAAAATTLAGGAALASGAALTGDEAVAERVDGALDAAVGALVPLPTTDVAGEDPEGFTRIPGFVRTAFQRGEDGIVVSYVGVAPQADVMAFHRQALEQAGYTAIVQSGPMRRGLRSSSARRARPCCCRRSPRRAIERASRFRAG